MSFVPVREKSLQEENIYKTGCVDIQALLLVAVVYGANGGGKSTLLSALQSMLAISSFAEETDTTYRIPVKPFLFDEESRKNPTEFEIFFLHEGYIYTSMDSAVQKIEYLMNIFFAMQKQEDKQYLIYIMIK